MKLMFYILAGSATLALQAASLPPLVLPQGVGVNIHFARGHEQDLDLIAAAGFKFIRMDFGWAGIEHRRGEYDWSAYEELTANLEKRGLHAIYILDYSNSLYEQTVTGKNPLTGQEHRDTASPQHPESIAAFAKWAAASARHFQGRPVLWEIWNEPNISFWNPEPNVQQYTALALATCQALREGVPTATILAPATSGIPMPFLETFFKSGILSYLDAVSVHPYRGYNKPPESAAADYEKLRALIDRYAPAEKKNLPIVSGEWGYASHDKGVSLETQAAYIVRQQLANLLAGIPISIWYDWKNDGDDAKEREHNFGTVLPDLTPKPAYAALKTMTHELAGYKIERRLKTNNDNDYLLLCTNSAGEQKLAAWTLSQASSASVSLTGSAGSLRVMTSNGDSSNVQVEGGRAVLSLGGAPVYVTIAPGHIR
jgi:hypothetical protein